MVSAPRPAPGPRRRTRRWPALGAITLLTVAGGAAAAPATAVASGKAATLTTMIANVRGWNEVRAWNGIQVWTTYSTVDRRWHVAVRRNGRISMPAGVSTVAFDVGPGPGGKPALAWVRCVKKICRVVVSDLDGRRARTVPGSEHATAVTVWGSRVAWVARRRTVMTRRFGDRGVSRLPGAPRRKCFAASCERPMEASVDDVELQREQLALITTYDLADDSSHAEVRTESVRGGPQRLVAYTAVAQGAQFWVGPTWVRGKLYFYKSCPTDCDEQGAYRYDPHTGAYEHARKSTTTLAGFAMHEDGRRAYEIPGPFAEDLDTVLTVLRLTRPLKFVRARAPVPHN